MYIVWIVCFRCASIIGCYPVCWCVLAGRLNSKIMRGFGHQLRAEVGEGAQRLVESRAENQTVRDLNTQVFLCSLLK
jgi:hypothetical protein